MPVPFNARKKLGVTLRSLLACNPEVERLMPEKRKEIASGKAGLQEMKVLIVEVVDKL